MEKTMITRVVPLPSSGSGDARIVRLGASRIVSRRNFLLQGGGALAALSLGSTGCSDNGTGPSDIGDGRNGPDVEEQSVDVIVVGARSVRARRRIRVGPGGVQRQDPGSTKRSRWPGADTSRALR